MLVNRRALSVHEFTSKDANRGMLKNIRLNSDGSTEATNGAYMVKVSPNGHRPEDGEHPETPGEFAIIPDEGITIPAVNAKAAEKAISKQAARQNPTLSWAAIKGNAWKGGQAEIVSTDLETVKREGFEVPDGDFPNTDKVREGHKAAAGEAVRIGMDARLLAQVCAFFAADRGKGALSPITLEINVGDANGTVASAMRITGTDEDGTGIEALLMPMKI